MDQADNAFDDSFSQVVELGNRIAGREEDAEIWDIADGLLAGAIQYWLYSRQPCGDRYCEDCAPLSTADNRLLELARLMKEYAQESEYYHAPTDTNVGRA